MQSWHLLHCAAARLGPTFCLGERHQWHECRELSLPHPPPADQSPLHAPPQHLSQAQGGRFWPVSAPLCCGLHMWLAHVQCDCCLWCRIACRAACCQVQHLLTLGKVSLMGRCQASTLCNQAYQCWRPCNWAGGVFMHDVCLCTLNL